MYRTIKMLTTSTHDLFCFVSVGLATDMSDSCLPRRRLELAGLGVLGSTLLTPAKLGMLLLLTFIVYCPQLSNGWMIISL